MQGKNIRRIITVLLAGLLVIQTPAVHVSAENGGAAIIPAETADSSTASKTSGDEASGSSTASKTPGDETSGSTTASKTPEDETSGSTAASKTPGDETSGSTASGASGSETTDSTAEETVSGSTILQGVKIGCVDVSGMTEAEATAAVSAQVQEMSAKTLTVNANGKSEMAAICALGFTWTNTDVASKAVSLGKSGNVLERYKVKKDAENVGISLPIERSYDEDAVSSFISKAAETTDVKPVSCTLTLGADGSLQVVDGTAGSEVDEYASMSTLMVYLNTGWESGDPSVDLVTNVTDPEDDREQLEKIKDVIGTGETNYAGSTDARCRNVENGVRLISGTLLKPGEQFSLLSHVVPFSAEHGYALAPSYAEGSVVDTYGGGICQVSTTLYLAVLQAELQVDSRSSHSMLVGYIQPSMDAAISEEGGKDLIFTNNTDSPIYIMGTAANGVIDFSIYGVETRAAGRTVAYRSETLSQTDATFSLKADDTIALGTLKQTATGHVGMEARLWKDVTENGKTVTTQVNDSTYNMSPIAYTVGTKTDNSDEKSAMQKAIADNELQEVYSVLASNGISVNEIPMTE